MAQVPPPGQAPHRGRFGEETYTQDSIVKVRLRRRRMTDAIPTEFAPVGYELLSYRASAGMSTIYSDNLEKCPPVGKRILTLRTRSAIPPSSTLDDHYPRTRRALAGDATHDSRRRYSSPLQRRQ